MKLWHWLAHGLLIFSLYDNFTRDLIDRQNRDLLATKIERVVLLEDQLRDCTSHEAHQ